VRSYNSTTRLAHNTLEKVEVACSSEKIDRIYLVKCSPSYLVVAIHHFPMSVLAAYPYTASNEQICFYVLTCVKTTK
jgi:hypothetical protein